MDKKRFLSFATAFACLVGAGSMVPSELRAADPDPYANTVEAADFAAFDPQTSFSVQAEMTIGQTFSWQGSVGYSFSYTAQSMTVYSFLVDMDNQEVTVWRSGENLEKIPLVPSAYADSAHVTNYPNLIAGETAGTGEGIYSTQNLFKNPGFETYATYTTGDTTTLEVSNTRGTPAFWDYATDNGWRLQNTRYQGSAYDGMIPTMEGNSAFMMHNATGLLTQHLTGLQTGQWYKVNWRQYAHGDTSPVTDYVAYILKDTAAVAADRSNVIATYRYKSAPQGTANFTEPLFAFRLPAGTNTDAIYFGVGKESTNTINHFDYMTLVAVNDGAVTPASSLTYGGTQITWQEGLQEPQGGEIIQEAEDVTAQYMVNPSFEENVDQQHNVSPYNPDASVETASATDPKNNGGINEPYGWTVAYSTVIQAGDIWDQANVNDGQTPADKNSGNSNRIALQPTDGTYFYYYRSRWYDDQDFTVSQTTKELPAGYYNITFDAGIPEGNTPVTVEVGDYIVEMTNTTMETFSFSVNLVTPEALRISFSSFKEGNGGNAAATLCVDNFKIYYCGEASPEDALASATQQMESYYARLDEYNPLSYQDKNSAAVQKMLWAADDAYLDAPQDPTVDDLQTILNVVATQKAAYNAAVENEPVFAEMKENIATAAPLLDMKLPGLADYQAIYDAANEAATTIAQDAYDEAAAKFTTAYCDSLSNLLITASRDYVLSGVSSATADEPYNIVANDLLQQVVSAPQFTKVGGDTSLEADRISTGWHTDNGGAGGDFRLNTTVWARAEGDTVRVNCWNNWSNNFSTMELYQEIPNLPEGYYTITAKETDNQTVWNDQHLFVSSIAGEAVGATPTVDISTRGFGEYTDMPETEKIWVPEGGTLRIGMKSTSGGDVLGWFCVTDFELFYYPAEAGAGASAVATRAAEVQALAEANTDATMGAEKDFVASTLAQAGAITTESTNEDITAALSALQVAEDTINFCVTEYAEFTPVLETAQTLVADPNYEGGDREAFQKVLNQVLVDLEAARTAGSGLDITYLDSLIADIDAGTADFEYSYQIAQVINMENSGALNGASEKTPVDMTSFIKNPTIEVTDGVEGWENASSNHNEHYSGDAANTYLDAYNSTRGALEARMEQTIYVPNGKYYLTCTARGDGEGAYIFANGDTIQIKNFGNKGGEIWENAEEGSEEKLANNGEGFGWCTYKLPFIVYDNKLTLGITTVCGYEDATEWNGCWLSADDFGLFCTEKGWSVGIEEVGAAEEGAAFTVTVNNGYITVNGAEDYAVYSISGTQVDAAQQLPAGTYIVTAGGKSVKVAVD